MHGLTILVAATAIGGCRLITGPEVVRRVPEPSGSPSMRAPCTPPAEQVLWFGEGPGPSSDTLYWFTELRLYPRPGVVREAECDGRPCLSLEVQACTELDPLRASLASLLESDRLTAGRRVGVRVRWSGPARARCEGPECGPVPYRA